MSCLVWTGIRGSRNTVPCRRYDPDTGISDAIETEDDRVEFLTTVTQAMAAKAKIKLNAKRLYAADGHAVKELLKISTMLYRCISSVARRASD